ncbi:carboxypeptidase-like regulatory domain-containing protein, partial [Planctomycetota bacterium]
SRSAILHITVLDPGGTLATQALVYTLPNSEIRKVSGGWQAEISSERLSSDKKVTVYAEISDKNFKEKAEVEAIPGKHVTVEIKFTPPPEAEVSGRVVDEAGKPVQGVTVLIVGFENEAVTTSEEGLFRLPAHAASGAQVHIRAQKTGMKETTLWHLAGELMEIMIRKGE